MSTATHCSVGDFLADARAKDTRALVLAEQRHVIRRQTFQLAAHWLGMELAPAMREAAAAAGSHVTLKIVDNFVSEGADAFKPPALNMSVSVNAHAASTYEVSVKHGLIAVHQISGYARRNVITPGASGPQLVHLADGRLAKAIAQHIVSVAVSDSQAL